MQVKITVLINTLNEENNIERVVKNVDFADEIVVVDDGSEDGTLEILRTLANKDKRLKVFQHKGVGYVEPVRNFAISKAKNEWILILDSDEAVPESLVTRLTEIAAKMEQIDFVRIPRKNIIFGHFMKESMWWPDLNIRFFKKGYVRWTDKIHRPPEVNGQGLDLPAEERYAIVHQNYETISQFIERMDRYTTVQAKELYKDDTKFYWQDLFEKPLGEFLSRYFAKEGYKDGLHGLALSLLQAFSFLVVYLKLWELEKFKEANIDLKELENQKNKSAYAINYWTKKSQPKGNFFKRIFKSKD